MKIFASRIVLLTILALAVTLITPEGRQTTVAALAFPNPVLFFIGPEYITMDGKKMVRYRFNVANQDQYPAELFAASPTLPPCGTNTNASRTWVDFYDQRGKRLRGFCALSKPADLNSIWFALAEEELPASWVYIELTDRKTNTKYKSNLAETTL